MFKRIKNWAFGQSEQGESSQDFPEFEPAQRDIPGITRPMYKGPSPEDYTHMRPAESPDDNPFDPFPSVVQDTQSQPYEHMRSGATAMGVQRAAPGAPPIPQTPRPNLSKSVSRATNVGSFATDTPLYNIKPGEGLLHRQGTSLSALTGHRILQAGTLVNDELASNPLYGKPAPVHSIYDSLKPEWEEDNPNISWGPPEETGYAQFDRSKEPAPEPTPELAPGYISVEHDPDHEFEAPNVERTQYSTVQRHMPTGPYETTWVPGTPVGTPELPRGELQRGTSMAVPKGVRRRPARKMPTTSTKGTKSTKVERLKGELSEAQVLHAQKVIDKEFESIGQEDVERAAKGSSQLPPQDRRLKWLRGRAPTPAAGKLLPQAQPRSLQGDVPAFRDSTRSDESATHLDLDAIKLEK